MKLGILGGTFNPVHYGHLRAAEEVCELLELDKILFIPSGKPPFKKSELADARHRFKMTGLAVKGSPHFGISDIELKRRGVSYSVDTLGRLTAKYKNAEFFLILGIDAFLDLPSWKHPEKLLSLANLVIISRPGFSFVNLLTLPYLKTVPKKTMEKLDKADAPDFYKSKNIFLCKITGFDVSASSIRRLITAGKSIKYLLPDSVESYIISNKLYKGVLRSRK